MIKLWLIALLMLLTGCTIPMIRPPETSAQGESVSHERGVWAQSTVQQRINDTMYVEQGDFDFGMTTFGMYPLGDIELMVQAAEEIGWKYAVQTLDGNCFADRCQTGYTDEEKQNYRFFSLLIPLSENSGNLFIRDASAFWRKYEELKVRKAVETYPNDVLTWEATTSFEYLGIFTSEETQRFRGAAEKLDWTYILFQPDALVQNFMFFLSLPLDLNKQDALNLFQQTARDLKGPQN